MNQKLVDTIVNALLYEDYILYPYRASFGKKRPDRRFGRVYPEACSQAQTGAEPCSMQTQCLVEGAPLNTLNIIVRFLHPMAREIGALAAPLRKMPAPDNPDFFHVVPALEIEGSLYSSWQEVVERPVLLPVLSLTELCEEPKAIPFFFPPFRAVEPILDRSQHIAGVIVRRQESVEGEVQVAGKRVDDKVYQITVRIINRTAVPAQDLDDDTEIGMRTFASTHTILHSPNAKFLSLIDPPGLYADAAVCCRNFGTWPILVGDKDREDRDTILSSPIILDDYPTIAPKGEETATDQIQIRRAGWEPDANLHLDPVPFLVQNRAVKVALARSARAAPQDHAEALLR